MTSQRDADSIERLRRTLQSVGETENIYRHELRPVVEQLERLLRLLPEDASSASISVFLKGAAERIEAAIGSFSGDIAGELDVPLEDFRREIAIAAIVDFGSDLRSSSEGAKRALAQTLDTAALARESSTEIERLLSSAQRLVSNAADDKLATHYRTQADDERDAANWWRRTTIGGLVLTVVLALVAAGIAVFGDRDLIPIISTGGLSLATAGLTGFLGSQTAIHRTRETRYRTAELQLAVIGPMIDAIGPDTRDQVRAEVAKRLLELGGNPP